MPALQSKASLAPQSVSESYCGPSDQLSTASATPTSFKREDLRSQVMRSAHTISHNTTRETGDASQSPSNGERYSNERAATQIARHQTHLDRESIREGIAWRHGSGFNSMDRALSRGGDRQNQEPSMVAGIGFTIKGSGAEREFKVDLLGDVGLAFSAAKLFSLKSEKASAIVAAIDPSERLAATIQKRTGWTNNPDMDTRSFVDRAREAAESRTAQFERWADAAYKDGGVRPGQFSTSAEAAAAYVNRLTTPLISEFKTRHPNVSREDLQTLHHAINEELLSANPNRDGGVGSFLKRLLKTEPNPGALERGALRSDTTSYLKELLAIEHKERVEKRRKG